MNNSIGEKNKILFPWKVVLTSSSLRDWLSNVQHVDSLKKIGNLYFSTVAGVLLGILISVLNTRSLSPALYGDVKYVTNIISFVSGFLLLGYFVSGSRLIAIEKDEFQIRKLKGALIIILGVTVILMISVMGFLFVWNYFQGNGAMAILFMAALPFCASPLLLNYVNTVAPGDNRINSIAITRLCPAALYLVVAFFIFKTWGATPVRMLMVFLGTTTLVIVPVLIWERPCFNDFWRSFKIIHAENRKYGIHVYIGSICGVSLGYLSGITLGWFGTNNTEVGLFSLALALSGPLSMLPSIVGTVFFRRFALAEYIGCKVISSTIWITVASLSVFITLIHPIVLILYSKPYAVVSSYAAWLAIGACLNGVGDMFNRFLGAHGHGRELRNGAIVCGLILLIGNIVGVYWFGIVGAIHTRNLAYFAYCAIMIGYYRKYTQKQKIQAF